MKKFLALALCLVMIFSLTACGDKDEGNTTLSADMQRLKAEYPDAHILSLNDSSAAIDGKTITEYDHSWHYDTEHEKPYYTGTAPDDSEAVYISHDIVYYPKIEESAFSKENYDGETEWVTHFTADGLTDYLFSTLPVLGDELPAEMMHSDEEAYDNPVIHIAEAGDYILSGSWKGQILIDLGDSDETFTDADAKVTVILNNADISCTVAPAVIFKSVYECDNQWESREEYGNDVDLSEAGAKVIVADGSENNIVGANVYRLLKPEYKKDTDNVQKKLYKTDGAFYSYVSMLIDGENNKTGILNITSTAYEGLDSELHLTINGGYVNIVSQDDGINVNEDDVSVFTMNGGHLVIFAGQGAEGDVVDSNGYITVNGGFIAGASPSVSDDILDCDREKKVSEQATIIDNTSSMMGEGMPMGGRSEGAPFGEGLEPPEGNPFGEGTEPPDKKPDQEFGRSQ